MCQTFSALWQQLLVVNEELQVSKQYSNHEKCESCFLKMRKFEQPQSVVANNSKPIALRLPYIDGKTKGTKEHCFCEGNDYVERGCIDFQQREKDAVKTECIENMAAREATLNRIHKEETGKLEREHSEKLADCTREPDPPEQNSWGPCLFLCLLVCICLALRCRTLDRELQACKKKKKVKAGARGEYDPHQNAVMIMAAVLCTQQQKLTLDSMSEAVVRLHNFDREEADRFRKLQGFMQQVDPTTASIWEDIAEPFKQKAQTAPAAPARGV